MNILQLNKLSFWNKFYIAIYSLIICMIIFIVYNFYNLNKISNPIEYIPHNSVIIEIDPEEDARKNQNKTQLALDVIKQQPYVISYQLLSKESILTSIKKYTGDTELINQLQLPIVITIKIVNNENFIYNADDLKIKLTQQVKGVRLDNEVALIKRVYNPINTSKNLNIIIPILLTIILFVIIFLIVYSMLYSNINTIKILLLLGLRMNTVHIEILKWIFVQSLKATALGISVCLLIMLILLIIDLVLLSDIIKMLVLFMLILVIPILTTVVSSIFVNNIIRKFYYKRS